MKKIKILFIGVTAILICVFTSGCESFGRDIKDIESNMGGLDRVITVYDYSGNIIKEYVGKCDIQENDNGKVLFDMNGKRTIIYNAVVIVEEQ